VLIRGFNCGYRDLMYATVDDFNKTQSVRIFTFYHIILYRC